MFVVSAVGSNLLADEEVFSRAVLTTASLVVVAGWF